MGKLLTAEDILCAELSPGKARLRRIAYRLQYRNLPVADDDLAFIADAFERIARGDDPKKALEITGRKHQGRRRLTSAQAERTRRYAFDVERYRVAGLTREEAIDRVAKESHRAFSTIETHHKKRGKEARAVLEFLNIPRRIQELQSKAASTGRAPTRRGAKK